MPGPAGLPGQPPMGFTPGGMSGYPPPGPPVGLRPPGVTMNPQLGAAAMPRPNMPGADSKYTSSVVHISCCSLPLCCQTRSSAIAEEPRDASVSTNRADTQRRHIPRLT